jgi:hypothetical protein
MRAAAAALLVIACGGHHDDRTPSTGSGSATPAPAIDWAKCEAAIAAAPAHPDRDRVAFVIEACPVCGDWRPLLDWQRSPAAGGPTRLSIDNAMKACGAYCTGQAHDLFLGTLDDARGADPNRTPWHYLAQTCKDKVSAAGPQERFFDARLFALDRIARAVGARSAADAAALAGVTIALPAVTVTGNGLAVPELDGVDRLDGAAAAGPLAISVMGDQLYVGYLPRAVLKPTGVAQLDVAADAYPGVATKDAAAELRRLGGPDGAGAAVAILAPRQAPAARIVEALRSGVVAAGDPPRRLAVLPRAHDDAIPDAWPLLRTIGAPLTAVIARDAIVIDLVGGGGVGHSDDGRTISREARIAAGPAPLSERLAVAVGQRKHLGPLAIDVGDDKSGVTVQQLAELLARLEIDQPIAIGSWPPPTKIADHFDPAMLESAQPPPPH